jgi:hypothetical protein
VLVSCASMDVSRKNHAKGTCHPHGCDRRARSSTVVPHVGTRWAGTGTAFTGPERAPACTLLACWEAGYKDPWCILTDRAPQDCHIAWYGVRQWIEIRQPHYPHTKEQQCVA